MVASLSTHGVTALSEAPNDLRQAGRAWQLDLSSGIFIHDRVLPDPDMAAASIDQTCLLQLGSRQLVKKYCRG